MKIVITGGTGFLGSNLAISLNALGHKVVILDKKRTSLIKNFPKNIKIMYCDIVSEKSLQKIKLLNFDAILHCAGQPSAAKSFEIPKKDLEMNILGTLNIIKWTKKNNIKKLIFASTFNVYEENNKKPILDELCNCKPKSLYAVSKLAAENYIQVLASHIGVKWNIIRMFNIYGPGQDPNNKFLGMINIFLNMAKKENKVVIKGSLKRFRDFVFINDVIKAWLLIIKDRKYLNQIFNVGSGEKTTLKQLLKIISEVLNKKLKIVEKKGTPGDFMGCVADIRKIKKLGYKPSFKIKKGLNHFNNWIESL